MIMMHSSVFPIPVCIITLMRQRHIPLVIFSIFILIFIFILDI